MSGTNHYLDEDEKEALLADYNMSASDGASTSYSIRGGPNGETTRKSRRLSSDEELLDSVMAREIDLERTTGFANLDHDPRLQGM